MLNKIKKAIEAKIEKTAVMRTLRAQQAAAGIKISFEDFCTAVDAAVAEQGQSWPYRVARYGHIMSADEVRDALTIKAGLFRYIPWVRRKIETIAKECDGKYDSSLFAETMTVEQGGRIDEVVFYYDYFAEKWWALDLSIKDWRLAIKEVVRHEYRHVEQIKELRRRGGSEYVHAALKAHMRVNIFTYKSDPMEADAYANQAYAPSDQSDLGTAVDKIVANF